MTVPDDGSWQRRWYRAGSWAGRAVLILGAVVALNTSVGTATESPDVESGERVFQANCAMCHGGDASGMMGMHPSLRGAVDRLTLEGVDVTVRNGRDATPPMPAFQGRLSEQELVQVVAYVESLPSGPRNFGPGDNGGGMMGGDNGGGMMGGMDGWMWLMPAFVVLAVVLAVIVLVRVLVRDLRSRSNRK